MLKQCKPPKLSLPSSPKELDLSLLDKLTQRFKQLSFKRRTSTDSLASSITIVDSITVHIERNSTCTIYEGIHLLNLPFELLSRILMESGFFACLQLRQTCRTLHNVLNHKETWHYYARYTPDVIENSITIITKLHAFDNLVFGKWPMDKENRIFFEHLTVSEKYDYFGGISISMNPAGLVDSYYFDHRENLNCYAEHVHTLKNQGLLPPSLTNTEIQRLSDPMISLSADSTGGVRIDHSCSNCDSYDKRTTLQSHLLLANTIPEEASWRSTGYEFVHPQDHRKTIRICIKPLEDDVFGYGILETLPWVVSNSIKIDNIQLSPVILDLFKRLTS